MNDYLLLKISEMALRAIERPRRGQWVFMLRVGNITYMFSDYPTAIDPINHTVSRYDFRPGTHMMSVDGRAHKLSPSLLSWYGLPV